MKISFSTLGCPAWEWNEIVSTAKDLGYNGIEVRGVSSELYAPNAKPFLPKNIDSTKAQLNELGLVIPCVTSSAGLHRVDDNFVTEVTDYARLAQVLGTPYIRVLGDTNANPTDAVDLSHVANNLKIAGEIALQNNATVLIETNGFFANTDNMLRLIEKSGTNGIGILWDIHHPYRFFGESLTATYSALKKHIKHIHIKDSIVINGELKYKLAGEGNIPISECLSLLTNDNYENYISLEWTKRWYEELDEPGIVFTQYINYVKTLEQKI